MSWGAWTLLVITPLAIFWQATWMKDIFPKWDWKYYWLDQAVKQLTIWRHYMALPLLVLALILGMYTGILLSAFNARPFWNTAILGPLFLTSGLSAAAAAIVYFAKTEKEKRMFLKLDMMLIVIELFMIVHMFMGLLAGTQVGIQAAEMFLGGTYTAQFWIFVVGLGLMLPGALELLEFKRKYIPALIPVSLIIGGNIMLRFIVVEAGQASRWLY